MLDCCVGFKTYTENFRWMFACRVFYKYRIHNFHQMMSNYFQFFCWIFFNIFYCLRFIKTIDKIEKNWKGKLKRIWRHWLKIEYSVLIKRIYNILSKKLSMDSVMFQVMLVILLDQGITGWSFLPRIEIMISLIFHVLNDSKVLGGTTYNTNTSNV